jgi:hypothetical protein
LDAGSGNFPAHKRRSGKGCRRLQPLGRLTHLISGAYDFCLVFTSRAAPYNRRTFEVTLWTRRS